MYQAGRYAVGNGQSGMANEQAAGRFEMEGRRRGGVKSDAMKQLSPKSPAGGTTRGSVASEPACQFGLRQVNSGKNEDDADPLGLSASQFDPPQALERARGATCKWHHDTVAIQEFEISVR
jgi:hypothetical protein